MRGFPGCKLGFHCVGVGIYNTLYVESNFRSMLILLLYMCIEAEYSLVLDALLRL